MFFPESRRKVHPEHESIVDPSNIHVNTDIVWHFFVVNTDLNAPRRRVFAGRHGQRIVLCAATSVPQPQTHVLSTPVVSNLRQPVYLRRLTRPRAVVDYC